MASGLEDAFDELIGLIYNNDSAVAGEAAGVSLGLIMLGTATPRTAEMLNFAHVTQHEKIIRSIGLGIGVLSPLVLTSRVNLHNLNATSCPSSLRTAISDLMFFPSAHDVRA